MSKSSTNSGALNEREGITPPPSINPKIRKNPQQRRKDISVETLVEGILAQNQVILSMAITLVESTAAAHQAKAQEVISRCLPHANKSVRIGITGVPGVGKSTFIESFGKFLISQGKRVAALTVDPSSSISKGSILGDKTRMEELGKERNAFIRPSASGYTLGGVARKTRESIILCEAAGFDIILIETVGVGQSETTVHSMTDFFLLLKLAGAGDELQGIKRGIMEMADCIVINKADGDNLKAAKMARNEFSRALHLYPAKESKWTPKTLLASALTDQGIPEIWEVMLDFFKRVKSNGYFYQNRANQNKFWLMQTIENHLKSDFFENPKVKAAMEIQLKAIEANKTTPFEAAQRLLSVSKER